MNKKGQALVEFILVLPIIILLIFALFDIGRIIMAKNHLENTMSECLDLASSGESIESINNYLAKDKEYKVTLSIIEGEYRMYHLETSVKLITPGLKRILNILDVFGYTSQRHPQNVLGNIYQRYLKNNKAKIVKNYI